MSKRSVVFNNDRKYECHVHQNNTNLTVNLAFPANKDKFHLSVLPLAGNIVFEEKIEVPEVTSIFIHSKNKIPLPNISRTRHPLLGADFIYQPKTYTKESNTCGKKRKHKNYKPDDKDFQVYLADGCGLLC
uniref:Uncharacterized protein n=1 Tax=Clastoptera arizonana TaxID=38151 RepID=A0A1B6CEP8_9HEMI